MSKKSKDNSDFLKVGPLSILADEIQKEIDKEIIKELQCVKDGWIRVMINHDTHVMIEDFHKSPMVMWLDDHCNSNEYHTFGINKVYIKDPNIADLFILRWL